MTMKKQGNFTHHIKIWHELGTIDVRDVVLSKLNNFAIAAPAILAYEISNFIKVIIIKNKYAISSITY